MPALAGLEHEGRMRALQAALRDHYGPERAEAIASANALRAAFAARMRTQERARCGGIDGRVPVR